MQKIIMCCYGLNKLNWSKLNGFKDFFRSKEKELNTN